MPNPFSRSMRSLESDSFTPWAVALGLALALLGLWTAWLLLAEIPLYEVTDSARVEAAGAVSPVEFPVGGRVATVALTLGQAVRSGQVLLELEADPERLDLQEARAQFSALSLQITAANERLEAQRRSLEQMRLATAGAVAEARARLAEAEVAARLAEEESKRKARLQAAGQLPELDMLRARSEAEKTRAAVEVLRATLERIGPEQRSAEQALGSDVAETRGGLAQLEGARASVGTRIDRLRHEIERRLLRAPIDGRVGSMASLRPGSVVQQGAQLCVLVPEGALRAVALFPPSSAIGRIRPGQRAMLRLDSFPWTVYGVLPARVSAVSTEVVDGLARVELALEPGPDSAIPLQHGLSGSVEVEVERTTPAILLLRATGRFLAGKPEAAS